MVDFGKTMKRWLEILMLNPNIYKGLEDLWQTKQWWQKGTRFGSWGLLPDFLHRILLLGETWTEGWYPFHHQRLFLIPGGKWPKGRGTMRCLHVACFRVVHINVDSLGWPEKNIPFLCPMWIDAVKTVLVLPNENITKSCYGWGWGMRWRETKSASNPRTRAFPY